MKRLLRRIADALEERNRLERKWQSTSGVPLEPPKRFETVMDARVHADAIFRGGPIPTEPGRSPRFKGGEFVDVCVECNQGADVRAGDSLATCRHGMVMVVRDASVKFDEDQCSFPGCNRGHGAGEEPEPVYPEAEANYTIDRLKEECREKDAKIAEQRRTIANQTRTYQLAEDTIKELMSSIERLLSNAKQTEGPLTVDGITVRESTSLDDVTS